VTRLDRPLPGESNGDVNSLEARNWKATYEELASAQRMVVGDKLLLDRSTLEEELGAFRARRLLHPALVLGVSLPPLQAHRLGPRCL
jgi:hypothetical protein